MLKDNAGWLVEATDQRDYGGDFGAERRLVRQQYSGPQKKPTVSFLSKACMCRTPGGRELNGFLDLFLHLPAKCNPHLTNKPAIMACILSLPVCTRIAV